MIYFQKNDLLGLSVAGCKISIISEKIITADKRFIEFLTYGDTAPDITVFVTDDVNKLASESGFSSFTELSDYFKHTQTISLYQIARLRIFAGPDLILAEMVDISDSIISIAVIDKNFSKINVSLLKSNNDEINLLDILNALPLYIIFANKDTAVLHASQVQTNGRGLLFSAPSGIGKTTQAKLWQKNGANLVSSDRSVVYQTNCVWKSRGYLFDGSTPAYSNRESNIAAIIFLKQSELNNVEYLDPVTAFKNLLKQTFIEHHYPDAAEKTIGLLTKLASEIPAYLLACTPTDEAVECLRDVLTADGVI